MDRNKISVLMSVWNCESTIREAIDSILAQTYDNWELILCDDCSSDSTYSILLDYQRHYPDKIKVIHNEKNLRLAASLNRCAQYATGKYIARMDGDDISLPDRFAKQAAYLDKHEEYAVVGTFMQAFDDSGLKNIIPIISCPKKTDLPKLNPFHHATVLMRKEVFDILGGYRVSKETIRSQDVDLWFRLFKKGYGGYNISEVLYYVREDKKTFKRRSFRRSIDSSYLLFRGIRSLKLPYWYYIYSIKPMVSQLLPRRLKRWLRSTKYSTDAR